MSDDFTERSIRCLAAVPGASMTAWVIHVSSVATCIGAMIIGVDRARNMIHLSEIFDYTNTVCIAVAFAMVFTACLALLLAAVSTGRTSRQVFNSSRKNVCGRTLNVMIIILLVILKTSWILMCALLVVPLAFFCLVHVLVRIYHVKCINLQHYAIKAKETEICGLPLEVFYRKSQDTMICFEVAFVASVLVVLSLGHFIVCTCANFLHLRDTRFSLYDVSSYNKPIKDDTRM